MPSSNRIIVSSIAFLLLTTSLLANFLGQEPPPSPSQSPSPSASPSASPSPSPSRTPSPTPLPGAQNFHQWGSVTVFNGLPSDSVRAIAQTGDGVMWFGTDHGLARFDGRRVQNLAPADDDASKAILALRYDDKGVLWIGTRAGAFTYFQNQFKPVAGTQPHAITSILLWDQTYLGTDSGLVLRLGQDKDGQPLSEVMFADRIRTADGAPAAITSLSPRPERSIVAGTSGGGLFVVTNGTAKAQPTAGAPAVINSIARTPDGDLWVGADATRNASGVYRLTAAGSQERIAGPTATVFALESNDAGIWAGTERFGLFHFAGSKLKKNYTFENTSGGLRSNTVYTLFTDREGVLWIGTNRGVSRFDRLGASQETVSDIPNSNFIRSLFRSAEGRIYAGSNRGLFEKNQDKWVEVASYRNRPIYALAEDASGRLLVGSSERNVDTRGFAHFRASTYAAVAGQGLVQLRAGAGQTLVHPDGSINSVAAAGDKLWIGTVDKGLLAFDGTTVRPEVDLASLQSGTIWKVTPSSDGSLWIAGQHGIFRISNGQPERIVEVEDVRDIFIDGDNVWAATTTRGLIHIRRHENFGRLVSIFGFEQGLPSEKAFSIIRSPDGGLLIGTNRGVVTYKAGSISPKLIGVRMISQRVHDLAEIGSTIQLDYPQKSLLVEVAGQSSRTFPEEFQYAFVLRNDRGDEWERRITNDPQYSPSDLPSGTYTIESTAFDRDLNASEPLIIRFSVAKAPFPWTATALAVLLLLSLVGLIWAIVEHRRIAERNRELAAARLDLANEAERERRRIARDLHDQTLADLRNLMITSDKLVTDNREFRAEIEAVSIEIRRICEDLSPSVLENVGLVAALEFLLDRTVANRRFHADAGVEERIGFPLNVQLQIYRIAQEVLTNIDRHSDADLVEMDVEASAVGEFALTIRDNGRLFHPNSTEKKGRGISNIRSRANLINGKVAWKESRGGNAFSLRVDGVNGGK